jgi:hypothetical protein
MGGSQKEGNMRYIQRHSEEGFSVPSGKLYRIACCDCGLVHDFVFVAGKGVVGIAARRNNRATAQRRRKKLERKGQ